jgi:hypothetical protein
MAKKNLKQKSALKTTLRLTMLAAVSAATGLVVLLIIVFNLAKEEEGNAQTSMTFKQATTIQDTTRILRGSINQKVIGVVVETSGKGTPVKVNSMTFTAKGTSLPIENNIENARLWYTGNDPEFTLQQTVGTTVNKLSDQAFVFSASMALLPGKNYFWLTVDVKPDAAFNPGMVDASCKEIRVGAIAYLPLVADPIGKRYLQANVPYFSMGNFALNKPHSWNSKRDGTGAAPRNMNESRNSYFIQAGHRMISATGSNLQTLVVEKGGELKITSPLRLNAMYVACGGVVQQDTAVMDFYCFNEFFMDNGAMYIHNNTGKMPGLRCFFAPKSSQVFFNYSEASFSSEINYGNVIIDAMKAGELNLGGRLTNVQGDFEIRRTGQGKRGVYFSGLNTLSVEGSLVLTGGTFGGASEGQLTCNVGRNLIVKGGQFTDVMMDAKKSSMVTNISGDVLLLGGSVIMDLSPMSVMNFVGDGTTRWVQKTACDVRLGNTNVTSGHTLWIKGENFADVSKDRTLNVMAGAEMLCEQVVVKGKGNFHLHEKALLGIGHTEGIYSKGELGNIQTSGRQFHSGATYYYYTSSQPQQTGIFTTYPKENAVYRLIVNKEQSTHVLNLSQNMAVDGQCKVNLGDIRNNGFELKMAPVGNSSN